jgi:hypothetical protein
MEDSELEGRYQQFKWDILGAAVYEDWQGLWEPLWYANTVFPDVSQVGREQLAERALRELFAEGLIVFFRRGGEWPHDDTREILDERAVEAAITGSSWRIDPLRDSSIWFGSTQTAEGFLRQRWPDTSGSGGAK